MWASPPTMLGRSAPIFAAGYMGSAKMKRHCTPYISHHQRQRRKRRDDSTFNAPCKPLQACGSHYNNLNGAGRAKGFLNLRFKRRFLHTFCRCWQKVCRRRQNTPTNKTNPPQRTDLLGDWSCFSVVGGDVVEIVTRHGAADGVGVQVIHDLQEARELLLHLLPGDGARWPARRCPGS